MTLLQCSPLVDQSRKQQKRVDKVTHVQCIHWKSCFVVVAAQEWRANAIREIKIKTIHHWEQVILKYYLHLSQFNTFIFCCIMMLRLIFDIKVTPSFGIKSMTSQHVIWHISTSTMHFSVTFCLVHSFRIFPKDTDLPRQGDLLVRRLDTQLGHLRKPSVANREQFRSLFRLICCGSFKKGEHARKHQVFCF